MCPVSGFWTDVLPAASGLVGAHYEKSAMHGGNHEIHREALSLLLTDGRVQRKEGWISTIYPGKNECPPHTWHIVKEDTPHFPFGAMVWGLGVVETIFTGSASISKTEGSLTPRKLLISHKVAVARYGIKRRPITCATWLVNKERRECDTKNESRWHMSLYVDR